MHYAFDYSHKVSHRQISWSPKAARLVVIMIVSLQKCDRHFGSTASSIATFMFALDPALLKRLLHYNDVIMSAMAFQITSLTIVYSDVYSGADQRKHQSSASLVFVREIHRWPVNSPHKRPVTRKCFYLMTSSWLEGVEPSFGSCSGFC